MRGLHQLGLFDMSGDWRLFSRDPSGIFDTFIQALKVGGIDLSRPEGRGYQPLNKRNMAPQLSIPFLCWLNKGKSVKPYSSWANSKPMRSIWENMSGLRDVSWRSSRNQLSLINPDYLVSLLQDFVQKNYGERERESCPCVTILRSNLADGVTDKQRPAVRFDRLKFKRGDSVIIRSSLQILG